MKSLPLAHLHQSRGARMGVFADWQVPIFFSRIRDEYFACRETFGLFDVSHLGKLFLRGQDSRALLKLTACRALDGISPGRGRYMFFLNHRGGIVDGVMVFPKNEGFWILTNAGAKERVFQWLHTQAGQKKMVVDVEDRTDRLFLFSLQGPASSRAISEFFCRPLSDLLRFSMSEAAHGGSEFLISRMSYSREDGFEIMGDRDCAGSLWENWLDFTHRNDGTVCGFGVRDLLRFEAAYPLYGQEMEETVNPLELGRENLIDWGKGEFIGRQALLMEQKQGSKKKLVGFEIDGKRIPRYGFPIQNRQGTPCGHITSGNYSFSLRKNLAMGFLSRPNWDIGQELLISVPRTKVLARIVPLPFTKDRVW
ncbi:MAG TPA: glycine cleavage system aminomethyltransferase GcvT [Atribacteraceae bacterium]|nr:glycine cleavage system aminomethyltransferase GcvT [Atribacteraceae bacterium]